MEIPRSQLDQSLQISFEIMIDFITHSFCVMRMKFIPKDSI
jgi:hypothetical protein